MGDAEAAFARSPRSRDGDYLDAVYLPTAGDDREDTWWQGRLDRWAPGAATRLVYVIGLVKWAALALIAIGVVVSFGASASWAHRASP